MNGNGIQIMNSNSNITVNSNNFRGGNININTNFSMSGNDWNSDYSEEENDTDRFQTFDSSFEEDDQYGTYNVSYNVNYGNNHYHQHYSNHNSNHHHHHQNMQQEPPRRQGLTQSEINQLPINVYTVKKTPIKPSFMSKSLSSKKGTKESVKKEESDAPSSNESCAICIGDYKHGEKLRTLPCMHKFHVECVDKWLKQKSDCPICKFDLLE